MSKEDHACKVTSVCKHKERKPKKPHYIPRPWGKPYNYKCFQCPFTCMEKSHLYNHMKYSLCKNSLSLLIESDWPYKKGNLLHPDQLRPLQQAHCLRTAAGKEEPGPASGTEERPRQRCAVEEEGDERQSLGGEEDEEEESRQGEGARESSKSRESSERATKRTSKRPETDLLMADMFSLEDQLLRARSVEVEAQLKHYKLPKTCLTAPGLLSEQWRLLANNNNKAKAEGTQPRVGSTIPCYPPPPGLVDYQDPTALNLSVLGVGYPLSPSLFSYMNSMNAIPTVGTNVNGATHAQLAQLPFLASAAQLMHPASSAHHPANRSLLPPQFYYPFLCEHAFGASSAHSDFNKGLKTSESSLEPNPSYQPKVNLWKVPALRPGATSPAGWVSQQRESPDPSNRAGDKLQPAAKDGKPSWGLKRTGAPLGNHKSPPEKKPALGFTLDLLKNIQNTTPISMATEKLLLHSSFTNAQSQSHLAEQWYTDSPASPVSQSPSPTRCGRPSSRDSGTGRGIEDASPEPESATALLSHLSKALQEYQEAERKISHLEKEDLPAQGHLWEHLNKIRSELSHIHHALERTARQSEGPLDLSVKKEQTGVTEVVATGDHGLPGASLKDDLTTETEEEEEEEEERDEEEEENERRKEEMKASLESRKQSLDVLIKMSQAGVQIVKSEVLSPGGLGFRSSQAEGLWPGRTTKCEADSSVLLCPDGRPITVFNDFHMSSKNSKRPVPIQRLGETQCPSSPPMATDS
ncbi:proline-rich protein 35 [Esox lucius]|uniref:Zinc finger protein 750-like zinc finger domain-containing protein n=1 Tax=Esox lucius TaxID=8010 RepID=A0A3P8ZSY4_ESOLU|nr:proline-rich protein 35 [Esox lucius]